MSWIRQQAEMPVILIRLFYYSKLARETWQRLLSPAAIPYRKDGIRPAIHTTGGLENELSHRKNQTNVL